MQQTRRWLLRWGPAMILLVTSVLSIQNWKTYWITEELWSEREECFDQLRTQELRILLGKRTEVETRLEQSRLTRRAENAGLIEKLEESLLSFEQSQRPVESKLDSNEAVDVGGA